MRRKTYDFGTVLFDYDNNNDYNYNYYNACCLLPVAYCLFILNSAFLILNYLIVVATVLAFADVRELDVGVGKELLHCLVFPFGERDLP